MEEEKKFEVINGIDAFVNSSEKYESVLETTKEFVMNEIKISINNGLYFTDVSITVGEPYAKLIVMWLNSLNYRVKSDGTNITIHWHHHDKHYSPV